MKFFLTIRAQPSFVFIISIASLIFINLIEIIKHKLILIQIEIITVDINLGLVVLFEIGTPLPFGVFVSMLTEVHIMSIFRCFLSDLCQKSDILLHFATMKLGPEQLL